MPESGRGCTLSDSGLIPARWFGVCLLRHNIHQMAQSHPMNEEENLRNLCATIRKI
jgi:hypothetical protein